MHQTQSGMAHSLGERIATMTVAIVVGAGSAVFATDRDVEPRDYEFHGSIGPTSVMLGGRGLPELYASCTDYVRKSGIEPVREIAVEGRHFIRRTGYFDRQQVCGFAVLNARPPGPLHFPETPILTGVIGGVPFRLWAPRDEALEAVRRFVPMAVGGLQIGTVIVGGAHEPHRGAWTVDEVVTVIERHLVPSPPLDYATHRGRALTEVSFHPTPREQRSER